MQITRDGYAAQVQAAADAYAAMKQLQGDWQAGAAAGMQDFIDQATNRFQQAHDFVLNMANGFSDAFSQFATGAESAKKAFGDWID